MNDSSAIEVAASGRADVRRVPPRGAATMRRFRSVILLIVGDAIAIVAPFFVARLLRPSYDIDPAPIFGMIQLMLYLLIGGHAGAFAVAARTDAVQAIRRSWYALAIALAVLLMAVFYLKKGEDFSRVTLAASSLGAFVAVALARAMLVPRLAALVGGDPFSAALIRDGDAPIPAGSFSTVLYAGDDLDPERHDPLMYDRLAAALMAMDRVVVTCPPERRLAWARALRGANIQGELAMPELTMLRPLGLGPDRAAPSVIVAVGPLSLSDRVVKRGFDLALAIPALIFLAPLMTLIALWVMLDSPGPVLFKQIRIGRANRMFRIYKFRSMRVGDAAGHRSTARDDDRITLSGRFIRRTSLDELPQLLNVVGGSMSIVGPRPHALGSRAADKLYWEVDSRYWDRHAAKPGLTGLAQIRGFRGATMVEDDLRNRLESDLEYCASWSIWRDVKIIVLTVRVLLHRNAF